MQPYIIWWYPTQQNAFATECSFIDIENATFVEPSESYPEGFNYVEQDLSPEQFVIVDDAADNHVCIDIKPMPHPPGSPLGR